MGNLQALMLPPVEEEQKEVMISDRFKEGDKVIPFKIKVISQETNEGLRKKASRPIRKNNTVVGMDFDTDLYGKLLLQACVVYPNFKDAELCDFYKTKDPLEVPGRMLTAGEYNKLIKEINILNGFLDDPNILEDEAKN
jgi:hypothetical protein